MVIQISNDIMVCPKKSKNRLKHPIFQWQFEWENPTIGVWNGDPMDPPGFLEQNSNGIHHRHW